MDEYIEMEENYINNFSSDKESQEEDENSDIIRDINEISFYNRAEYEFENIYNLVDMEILVKEYLSCLWEKNEYF